jgi:hypothetical protein
MFLNPARRGFDPQCLTLLHLMEATDEFRIIIKKENKKGNDQSLKGLSIYVVIYKQMCQPH